MSKAEEGKFEALGLKCGMKMKMKMFPCKNTSNKKNGNISEI